MNPDVFRDKVKSRFMSKYFSYSGDETAQTEMTKALNAILNALPDITDEKAVAAINNCTREDASNLWEWVYQEMFNTTDLGVVMRDDIHDKHGYLVKVMNYLTNCPIHDDTEIVRSNTKERLEEVISILNDIICESS